MVIGTPVEGLAGARTATTAATGLALSGAATVIVPIKTQAEHLDVSISLVNPGSPCCLDPACMIAIVQFCRSIGTSTFLTSNSRP